MAYIFPDFSGKPEIVIPRDQIPWLLEQPDNVLSVSEHHYDTLEGSYSFTHPQILKDPYHEHVVHKYLPRRLGQMIPSMFEEVSSGFDDIWGTDITTWKALCVHDSMMSLISRAVNRMIVGLPLCRNEDYLMNTGKFAMDVIFGVSVFLRFVPQFLKPVFGPLATLPNRYHYRNTAKYALPLIKERLSEFKRKQEHPEFEWEEPNDYLQWHISLAAAENRQDELTPDMISRRLMPISFAAIHTTTLTITNVLFDLVSSDPSQQYLEGIREEATRVLAEEGGHWTKSGLAKCHRSDSAVRESMRISNFMTRGLLRKVVAAGGIKNRAGGWQAPKGAYVGTDVHSVQHDPLIYPSPDYYDAFRFSRPREEANSNSDSSSPVDTTETLRLKNTGIVTTSDTFLPFGHGRHACPGRFFVALELKMLLAYMVMNYEIEPLPTRPPNKWFGQTLIPPMKATIKVRRRDTTC